ncbi:glycosyltransferase [Synechococcus sp. CBW1006]|uniref:glycosyltransferase n=1 Tax=Synechococcus sp. CBW1006 TaxID=1353138 RepID=UPI001E3DBC4C|nr:glycosyltransferase [Synechococcus sp. CBW1006]
MTSRPLLIVLTSLAAEGCPQLALQLARNWQQQGLSVELLCLQDQPTDLRPEFEALGIPIHNFELGSSLLRYPRLTWLSYRLCRRLRPQAVLSFPLGWHSCIAIGARAAGVRRVCAHVGNLPPVWTGSAFAKFKLLVQLGRPFTDRLFCCSHYIRAATVRDFGVSQRETRTVYNACDLERFAVVQQTANNSQLPRLGVVGRLDDNRDYPTLIRAVAILQVQGICVSVQIIGEGRGRPLLEALISRLNLSDQVHLLGMRRDIPLLLSQLDIFVWPAFHLEGFGIALAEAMAAGVPIVATDVGACREVLDDGRCGLLVKPNSAEALADGIRQVLAAPEAARQRSASARQRALRLFSVAAMAQAYGEELGMFDAFMHRAMPETP